MGELIKLGPDLRDFIIGIDPGKKGAIVGLDRETGSVGFMEPMPLIQKKEFNPTEFLLTLRKRQKVEHVFLEMAQSFRGQGIVSTFNYARDFGIIIGILTAAKIPYTLVRPKIWQKEMFTGTFANSDPKVRALQVASRLWPHVSFLNSPRCKVAHDGMIDAALIAEYGRRLLR